MEPSHGTPLCVADVFPSASPPVATAEVSVAPTALHAVPPTLQDLAAVPGLGALTMAAVPLPDRVRLRGLCHAFKTSVDASLQYVQVVGPNDLFGLDKRGRFNGDVLTWLAAKCPNLHVLEVQGGWPAQHLRRIPVANDVITHLATHCRKLQTLNLHGCKGVNDTGLQAVAANCGDLRHLGIGCCRLITDAGVSAVAAGCRHLEHLNVRSNNNLTDASMLAMAAFCPCLRHLNVESTGVGNTGIIAIAQGCPHLRTLNVSFCARVGDDGMVAVADSCRMLESVECASFSHVGEAGMAAVIYKCLQLQKLHLAHGVTDRAIRLGPNSCRKLRRLTIDSRHVTNDALTPLAARCGELTSLSLDVAAATDAVVMTFAAHCPRLEQLHLLRGKMVTDAGVLAVANNCPGLRIVDIKRCQGVTDASLVELARHCPGLQVLTLSESCAGNSTLLAIAQHCPDLRCLDLSGRPSSSLQVFGIETRQALDIIFVEDDGLAAVLHNCLRLETLNLSHCRGLTDAGIMMRGDSCKRLRELHLTSISGCFTDQGLAAMAPNLGALEVLNARDCDAVTDVSVVALASHCPRLKDVDVSFCNVGDEGIGALARHCPLVTLMAKKVTDAAMAAIGKHCSQLEDLTVNDCQDVTAAGIMVVVSNCIKLQAFSGRGCWVSMRDAQVIEDMGHHLEHLTLH